MCIEELKGTCVGTSAGAGWEVVNLHRKLFQLRDTPVKLRDERAERCWI